MGYPSFFKIPVSTHVNIFARTFDLRALRAVIVTPMPRYEWVFSKYEWYEWVFSKSHTRPDLLLSSLNNPSRLQLLGL